MRNLWLLPAWILETIGRYTYKSIFWLIAAPFRAAVIFSSLFKESLAQLQSIKLPKVKPPKVKFPKVKVRLLKIKLPKTRKRRAFRWPPLTWRLKLTRPELKPWQYLIMYLILTGGLLFYWFILKDLPRPTQLTNRPQTLSTKIYDRGGTLLFTFYKDQNRTLINLNEAPDYFINATLEIEDSQFYHHNGFSWKGILRSINQIVFKRNLQGGSTITQQLVKSALLTPDRTLVRKIKELILAIEVEFLYSKDEILEMYLNQVSYGGTAYGSEQAA